MPEHGFEPFVRLFLLGDVEPVAVVGDAAVFLLAGGAVAAHPARLRVDRDREFNGSCRWGGRVLLRQVPGPDGVVAQGRGLQAEHALESLADEAEVAGAVDRLLVAEHHQRQRVRHVAQLALGLGQRGLAARALAQRGDQPVAHHEHQHGGQQRPGGGGAFAGQGGQHPGGEVTLAQGFAERQVGPAVDDDLHDVLALHLHRGDLPGQLLQRAHVQTLGQLGAHRHGALQGRAAEQVDAARAHQDHALRIGHEQAARGVGQQGLEGFGILFDAQHAQRVAGVTHLGREVKAGNVRDAPDSELRAAAGFERLDEVAPRLEVGAQHVDGLAEAAVGHGGAEAVEQEEIVDAQVQRGVPQQLRHLDHFGALGQGRLGGGALGVGQGGRIRHLDGLQELRDRGLTRQRAGQGFELLQRDVEGVGEAVEPGLAGTQQFGAVGVELLGQQPGRAERHPHRPDRQRTDQAGAAGGGGVSV